MWDQLAFWIVQGPGWVMFFYLAVSQCLPAFSYDLGVRMGTQDPPDRVTPVGVAFFWGFALADLVFYVPALGVGLVAHWIGTDWAPVVLGAALGITVYWPIVCLTAASKARGTPGWNLPNEGQYWVALPLIAGWAFVALVLLARGM